MPKRNKRPNSRVQPEGQKSARNEQFSDVEQQKIEWRFGILDLEGDWGWKSESNRKWCDLVFPKLKHFETMTWINILQTSGGRKQGNNHHPVKVEKLSRKAKKRLVELKQEDVSELFSIRLTSTIRLYGIRDRNVLKLLWYDRYHGDNNRAVYPTTK